MEQINLQRDERRHTVEQKPGSENLGIKRPAVVGNLGSGLFNQLRVTSHQSRFPGIITEKKLGYNEFPGTLPPQSDEKSDVSGPAGKPGGFKIVKNQFIRMHLSR
jgi:hypothetical protein